MAGIGLSILQRQSLDRRTPDDAVLKHEIKAWEGQRNTAPAMIDWRFICDPCARNTEAPLPVTTIVMSHQVDEPNGKSLLGEERLHAPHT